MAAHYVRASIFTCYITTRMRALKQWTSRTLLIYIYFSFTIFSAHTDDAHSRVFGRLHPDDPVPGLQRAARQQSVQRLLSERHERMSGVPLAAGSGLERVFGWVRSTRIYYCYLLLLRIYLYVRVYSKYNNPLVSVYADIMEKVKKRLLGPFNIELVVIPINVKISEGIMNFQENAQRVSQKVMRENVLLDNMCIRHMYNSWVTPL